MPYKTQTPEQLDFARARQRVYSTRYRLSAKGKIAKANSQRKYHEAHREELDAARRVPCKICGGPKEPGRGFRKCNKCWGVRPERDLDQLIAEQASDIHMAEFQPPQRFGDNSAPGGTVLPLDWRDDLPDDIWSDPTAEEALG